jgi:hypothetical protein
MQKLSLLICLFLVTCHSGDRAKVASRSTFTSFSSVEESLYRGMPATRFRSLMIEHSVPWVSLSLMRGEVTYLFSEGLLNVKLNEKKDRVENWEFR